MKKTVFVVNPVAGNGRGLESSEKIRSILNTLGSDTEIYLTKGPADATRFVAGLNSDIYEKVIAVGGDGTVNEVSNGVMRNGGNLAFSVVAVGSGNDFVRMLGNPKKLKDNIRYILEKKDYKSFDIVKVQYKTSDNKEDIRYFINSLGIGFDSQVAYIKSISSGMTGIKAYIIALIRALKTYRAVTGEIILDSSDKFSFNSLLLTLGNGVTSGGGFFLNPRAKTDDGILDLTIIRFVSRLKILYKLPLALLNKLEKVPEAEFYNFQTIKIVLDNPYYIHVDGEVISDSVIFLEAHVLKSAIKIC